MRCCLQPLVHAVCGFYRHTDTLHIMWTWWLVNYPVGQASATTAQNTLILRDLILSWIWFYKAPPPWPAAAKLCVFLVSNSESSCCSLRAHVYRLVYRKKNLIWCFQYIEVMRHRHVSLMNMKGREAVKPSPSFVGCHCTNLVVCNVPQRSIFRPLKIQDQSMQSLSLNLKKRLSLKVKHLTSAPLKADK